jgi:hypothetical protein
VLHWLNGKLGHKHLQQIFGLTPATLCDYLNNGLLALEQCLVDHTKARVVWPTRNEMSQFANMIRKRYPFKNRTNIFAFADGTTLPVQNSSNTEEQTAYYSFTKSRTVVNNVLCFTPDGCMCHATINAPGSWHDSNLASTADGLYHKLKYSTPSPYKCVVDQGFIDSSVSTKVACPLRDGQRITGTPDDISMMLAQHKHYTTVRQAAEWGMRAWKSSFARLTVPLPVDQTKRHRLLHVCVRLYNYRVRQTGINQIRTTYNTLWSRDAFANHQHDRVARYYRIQINRESE